MKEIHEMDLRQVLACGEYRIKLLGDVTHGGWWTALFSWRGNTFLLHSQADADHKNQQLRVFHVFVGTPPANFHPRVMISVGSTASGKTHSYVTPPLSYRDFHDLVSNTDAMDTLQVSTSMIQYYAGCKDSWEVNLKFFEA